MKTRMVYILRRVRNRLRLSGGDRCPRPTKFATNFEPLNQNLFCCGAGTPIPAAFLIKFRSKTHFLINEIRRGLFAASIVFIFAITFAPRPALAEQAATIIKVDGTVKVQRQGKEKTIKGKFPLAWGDKILVTNGSARIVFTGCTPMTISADFDIAKVNAPKNCGGAASKVKNSSKKTGDLKAGGGAGATIRAYEPGVDIFSEFSAPIVNILSVNGRTAAAWPVFRWEVLKFDSMGRVSALQAEKTVARLIDEKGNVIWSVASTDTRAAYPDVLPPLAGGATYTLEVVVTVDGHALETAIASFTVLSDEELREINDEVSALKTEYADEDDILLRHSLLALYYKQNEMYTEAVAELQDLIALDPNDIDSCYELADIYQITNNKTAFTAAIQKAESLEFELDLMDMPSVDEAGAAGN